MDSFADQLAALCKAHPTRAKWVFVPTHGIGRTLGDRLVLEGTDWANLRFVTPLDIALRMGAPFLVERGIDPSEEQLGPALIMRLLLGLSVESEYFRPLAHEPSMAAALWSTLRELRSAGIRATGLTADGFESDAKHAELCALLEAYEQHLASRKLGDQATVYEEALAHTEWCPIKADDCWTTLPHVTWSPLQERLFAAMPGERLEPHVGRGFSGLSAVEGSRAGSGLPASFFTAGGPEAEVEEVIRRILKSGKSLDQVEIACAAHGYATLIWEKACRYEWPVTLAMGLPATLTRPGRALLGLVEWVEEGFQAGRLRRLLQSGDVKLSSDFGPSHAARLLLRAEAAWGRATYRLALTRLEKSARARAAQDISDSERQYQERLAVEAAALADWIDALMATIPEPGPDNQVALQPLVDGAVAFLEHTAARASALDHAAADRLVTSLKELRALGDFQCPLSQALRFVRERVESLTIGADRPRPGHLHVSQLRTAAYANRPQLFVVGLEEGRVFPAAVEDPVLLDRERAAVGLRLSATRLEEVVTATLARLDEAMSSVMATAGNQIVFSYSCRDLRQFRSTYASWVMLQAFRRATGNLTATYQDLHKAVGAPVSTVPASQDEAPAPGRWWLYGAAEAGEASRTAVLNEFTDLAQGVKAEAHRDSASFTEYDGFVPEAGVVLDPAQTGRVVSPTQLEGVAKCPFRYFLERGLGVRAIESGDRDRDVWLTPLIRGSLLHDLYAAFLTRCRDDNRVPALPADLDWLLAEGQNALDNMAREMPAPSAEVLERESRDFLEDLTLFANAEVESAGHRTAVALEEAFGPFTIDAGGVTFTVRGRIDRIDRIGAPDKNTFEILDYKTGSYYEPSWKGTFDGGRRLQHALYGLAAAELLRAKNKNAQVTGATYYFSSAKGGQHRKFIPMQTRAEITGVLTDVRQVIASGLFVHTPDKEDCKFCEYGAACGPRAHERAEAKLAAPELTPYMRLAGHE